MNIELAPTSLQPVKNIKIPEVFYRRVKTGIKEFDDFISGGWLPGSAFTFTARAGLGKSTLMLQALEGIRQQGNNVAYISCEESIYQIAYNCERLNVMDVNIANLSDIDDIIKLMPGHQIMIVDSFQGLSTKHGFNSRDHEKYCIEKLINEAKKNECVIGIICHQTKTGELKGSSLILHEVDAIMELRLPEEMGNEFQRRISIIKNRFGATKEIACEMKSNGYIFNTPVDNVENANVKPSRRQLIWKNIMSIQGDITIKQVMPIVNGDVHKAMMVLREMVLNEMLIKKGRGNEATYKKAKAQIT